jgi:hypothetical protein
MLVHPAVGIMEELTQLKQYFKILSLARKLLTSSCRQKMTDMSFVVVHRRLATQMVTIDSIGHSCFVFTYSLFSDLPFFPIPFLLILFLSHSLERWRSPVNKNQAMV